MIDKKVMKRALEALEVANSCVDGYYIPKGKTYLPEIELVIIAIKEALANEALNKKAKNARKLGLDYKPEQEPVAQRKPLTDDEINAIWNSLIATPDYSREMIARAIEAAHGIKENT